MSSLVCIVFPKVSSRGNEEACGMLSSVRGGIVVVSIGVRSCAIRGSVNSYE